MNVQIAKPLVLWTLLAVGNAAWGQGIYPYPYTGRPTGPRTVYYPLQPVQAAPAPAVAPAAAVAVPANTIPYTAGYASAAYSPTPYAGWAGTQPAAAATPLTWFPRPAVTPVVAGYAPAPAVVTGPRPYVNPAGGGLIPAAPAVAVPAAPVVSVPTTTAFAPQVTAGLAPAPNFAPTTAYSPITTPAPAVTTTIPQAVAPAVPTAPVQSAPIQAAPIQPAPATTTPIPAVPVQAAPIQAAPVTSYSPVTAYAPVAAAPVAPATGGYFPITLPGTAALPTNSTSTPGYVAYSNPFAKYYVPPVYAYRPYEKSVPVTYYRPVPTVVAGTGQQVNYMAPCVGVEKQPYTTQRVFAYQPGAATCGPQGCNTSSCSKGTCGTPNPYYQPAPVITTPGVVVPGAGPAASVPPSLPSTTIIPARPSTTLPSTTLPSTTLPPASIPPTLPSTTIPATPLPPAGTIPTAPTFPGFNLPRTTIPPPSTVFPGTSGASVVPPTTITPGTSTTIRTLPGSSGADLAPRLDPNYIPTLPESTMYPPIDDGAGLNRNRTSVSPEATLNRSESAATQRPLLKVPFNGGTKPPAQVPASPTPTSSVPSFGAPLNGKTISEPGPDLKITPVPDPDHPPVNNRAPQLINPRDKTA